MFKNRLQKTLTGPWPVKISHFNSAIYQAILTINNNLF